MSDATDDPDRTVAPSDAFQVLGNETRMTVLRALVESDDEYRLTYAGIAVVRAIAAGTYTRTSTAVPSRSGTTVRSVATRDWKRGSPTT